MIAPASLSLVMLHRSMWLAGVSRYASTSLLRSLRATAAARLTRLSAIPAATAPRVLPEQGTISMPRCRKDPEAIEAPTSLSL